MAEPKDPWSEDQLQSTPTGPPDATPWKSTFAVIAILALLVLGALPWYERTATKPQASPPASVR